MTLLQATPDEIKSQLEMTLGDWVILKNHLAALKTFYGVSGALSVERLNEDQPEETMTTPDINGIEESW